MTLEVHDSTGAGATLRVSDPEWSDVERALRRLDGDHYMELMICDSEDTGLMVLGGADRYVCNRIATDENWVLMDPSKSEDDEIFVTKNETGASEYPESWTVDLDSLLKAARTFFETGELDPDLTWED